MSLDYALEKFPMEARLRDGLAVVVRPLGKRDETKLQRFLLAVPEEERLFIKHPVTDRKMLRSWCELADYERNLPLLMLAEGRVIGEATLHQRQGGWKRHIGLVTLLTHPDYRGRDVSKILVRELIEIAGHLGLKRLEAEINGERKIALAVLSQLGFRELVRLPDYVMDMECRTHDYVVLGVDVVTEEEYASAG